VKILAFDTSSTSGSIALLDDGRLIGECTAGDVGTHADWLMPAVDALLKSSSARINEIDLFAAGVGPGSFTGLRVGISAVKGLAWSLKKNVAGVSTLKALALNLRYSGPLVCSVLDARKGEIYAALYGFSGDKPDILLEESALPPDKLFRSLQTKANGRQIVFLGSGLKAYSGAIKGAFKDAVFAPEPLWHVRASNIAILASEDGARNVAPEVLSPVYLRKSEVELKTADSGL
jgi:tRNA threonylcarbamoyladenosine biosynthesis protein TsaB